MIKLQKDVHLQNSNFQPVVMEFIDISYKIEKK